MSDDHPILGINHAIGLIFAAGIGFTLQGFGMLVAPGFNVNQNHQTDKMSDTMKTSLTKLYQAMGWGAPLGGGMAFLGLCGGTATKYSLHDNSVYDGLFVAMGTFFLAWTILWLWMYKRGDIEYFKMKMPMYVFYMASTIAMTVLHFVPVNYNCFDTESVACPLMLSDTEAVEGWKIKGKKALLLVDAIFMLLNFVQSFPYAKLLANQMMNMDELDKETQTVVLEMFQSLGGFGAATMANIAFCAYASLENYDAIMMAGTLKGYSVRVSLMVLPIFGAGINLLVGSIMFLVWWRRGATNKLNFKMPFFWFYQVQFWVFAILFFLATDYDLVGLPLSD